MKSLYHEEITIAGAGHLRAKKNVQTLTKQLQNNFKKVQKTTFMTQKIVKNDPTKPQK